MRLRPDMQPSPPSSSSSSQLTSFFHQTRGRRVHIEFHPSPPAGVPASLQIHDENIAIPKPILLEAFAGAHATFAAAATATDGGDGDAQSVLDSSLVLLLVAPENLTAVNARRRIVCARGADAARDEARLVESLLTSPLQKHNKSSVLWDYRRWLVEEYGVEGGAGGLLEGELKVVEMAGESHPRNYYAWNYARFITKYMLKKGTGEVRLEQMLDRQARFCLAHVSDTSVWSFLLFLFFLTLEVPGRSFQEQLAEITVEAMGFVHGIARGHESAWVFLRTVLASRQLLERRKREELIALVVGWVGEGGDGEEAVKERELEGRALKWIARRNQRGD